MGNFKEGFDKTAAIKEKTAKGALDVAKKVLRGSTEAGKSYTKGLLSSGEHRLGDVLKMKGLYSTPAKAIEQSGGIGKALKTERGRKLLSSAVGKVTPQAAAAAGYGYAGKKLYDKTLGSNDQSYASMGYYQ